MAAEASAATTDSTNLSGALAAGKTLILSHPVGFAIAGGALLGVGVYYMTTRLLKKRKSGAEEKVEHKTAVAAEEAPAAA